MPVSNSTRESSVSLYRLLYEKPLTLDEIVKQMDTGFHNDAYRAYCAEVGTETLDEVGKRQAWRWWVRRLLRNGVSNGRVLAKNADGRPARRGGAAGSNVYAANRDKPPVVRVRVIEHQLVRWTPEIGKAARRHVGGLKFLRMLPALRAKRLPADVVEALMLAEEAIRGLPQERTRTPTR